MSATAKFFVGQLVRHKLFDYRGAIFDVHADFQGSDQWYEHVAASRPPKDEPWYRVLVHGAQHDTYVAERNLEPDESGQPIVHPQLTELFAELRDGAYVPKQIIN